MKLATIEKILNIVNIPGKENIKMATVLGWEVVIKKDEFQIDDFCVYIPIDTEIELKRDHFSHIKNKRIKTAKFNTPYGPVYSQGLCITLSSVFYISEIKVLFESGDFNDVDISNFLGVIKHYYITPNLKLKVGNRSCSSIDFPTNIISKTDEDNLKSKPRCLQEIIDKEIYISLKLDGSSMTLIWKDNYFTCNSRNLSIYKIIIDNMTIEYEFESEMVNYVKNKRFELLDIQNFVIQGEFVGWKINGNKMSYQKGEYDFFVFTIKNITTGELLSLTEMQEFCIIYGFKMVPILETKICTIEDTITSFQNYSNSVVYEFNNGLNPGEGIIIRPTIPFYSTTLKKNFSVKIINQLYNSV